MTKLGIIGAMQEEIETLLGLMGNKTEKEIAGSVFHQGLLEGLPVTVVQCGIGKVNAALCAQILCDLFGVTHLVNTGIAGSLCAELDIGDLVVSQDAMYHDMDATAFGYPMGKVPQMDVTAFPADDTLIGYAFAAAEIQVKREIMTQNNTQRRIHARHKVVGFKNVAEYNKGGYGFKHVPGKGYGARLFTHYTGGVGGA